MKKLTKEQRERVIDLLEVLWWPEDEPWDYEFVEKGKEKRVRALETPEEVHAYAQCYNWDDGEAGLYRVLEHPLCDQGTALMLFWLGTPAWFYTRVAEGELKSWAREGYRLLKYIEARYLAGEFNSRCIRVDPRNMLGDNWLQHHEEESRGFEAIPEQLKQPSPGEPFSESEPDQ